MARPKKSNQLSSETIVAVAETIFARDGFAAARLEDIASELGISRPSLLYHCGSKEALYDQTIRQMFEDLAFALAAPRRDGHVFEQQLQELLAAFNGFLEARPAAAKLILREVTAEEGPGRQVLKALGGSLVDEVVAWATPHSTLAAGLSIRGVLMSVVSDALLRHSGRELSVIFWGQEAPSSWALVRATMLGGAS